MARSALLNIMVTAAFKAGRSLTRDFGEVERAVFQWVAWYNSERLHSALGYIPPDEYEQAYQAQLEEAPQTA